MERLQELLAHCRRTHSALQIDHFIVTQEGAFCDYGALRQALRGLQTRVGVITEGLHSIREIEIEVDELQAKISGEHPGARTDSEHEKMRWQLGIDRAKFQLACIERDMAERGFELAQFYGLAAALKDRIESEHGELTPELHSKLDAEMWEQKLLIDAAGEIAVNGKPGMGTHRCVMSLPIEMRSRISAQLMNPQGLLSWAGQMQYKLPPQSARPVLTPKEVCAYVANADSPRLGIH